MPRVVELDATVLVGKGGEIDNAIRERQGEKVTWRSVAHRGGGYESYARQIAGMVAKFLGEIFLKTSFDVSA